MVPLNSGSQYVKDVMKTTSFTITQACFVRYHNANTIGRTHLTRSPQLSAFSLLFSLYLSLFLSTYDWFDSARPSAFVARSTSILCDRDVLNWGAKKTHFCQGPAPVATSVCGSSTMDSGDAISNCRWDGAPLMHRYDYLLCSIADVGNFRPLRSQHACLQVSTDQRTRVKVSLELFWNHFRETIMIYMSHHCSLYWRR